MFDNTIVSEKFINSKFYINKLKSEYKKALPFPNIVIDNFFDDLFLEKVFWDDFLGNSLPKSINMLIRTRIFENYNKVVKCKDCSFLVHDGLIPRIRIHEALHNKQWRCVGCKTWN